MAVLKDSEIKEALQSLAGWKQARNSIERMFEFPDFSGSIAFVNSVAKEAEAADHHPDIDIRFNKVKLVLSSHDSGGVTQRDIKMAGTINRLG